MPAPVPAAVRHDPRHYQIAVLSVLLLYGVIQLGFPVTFAQLSALALGCLGTQLLLGSLYAVERVDLRSPVITALSLSLLLRVDAPQWALAAGALAVASKFLLRYRQRHLFNPAAFAIMVLVLGTEHAWVSPGQWGHVAFAWLAMAGAGMVVLTRAGRLDITAAFVLVWALIVTLRAAWLGDPMAIAVHQLGNGALVLFAFFMISDPRTTPARRSGRIVFAACVGLIAALLSFSFYRADGLIIALGLCAPLVPFIDHLLPARPYRWAETPPPATTPLNRSALCTSSTDP